MPTKVPTKPWAGCAGKIDHGGARKSAREGVATSVRQRTQGFVRAGAPGGGDSGVTVKVPAYRGWGGGVFHDGNISLWEISYFKCVRNFPAQFSDRYVK